MSSAVESLGKTSDPDITAQLHAILAEDVRRLDRSITDISELSRLGSELSRASFEPIDVGTMLTTVVEARALRHSAGVPDVVLTPIQSRLNVLGDEPRLIRAVENLIDNAISFSQPDDKVRISALSSGDDINIVVDDNGPGVPADRREAIFRRFHSERPDDDFARHSGLGLAIAETIVEAMGGEIVVKDAPSGGARFVIRLPTA